MGTIEFAQRFPAFSPAMRSTYSAALHTILGELALPLYVLA